MRTLLHSNGMTGVRDSERIMSLNVDRKVVWDHIPQRMTIGWVRFDSFPDYRINNACMSQFKETTTQLLLLVLCMSGEHVGSTNYKLQLKIY